MDLAHEGDGPEATHEGVTHGTPTLPARGDRVGDGRMEAAPLGADGDGDRARQDRDLREHREDGGRAAAPSARRGAHPGTREAGGSRSRARDRLRGRDRDGRGGERRGDAPLAEADGRGWHGADARGQARIWAAVPQVQAGRLRARDLRRGAPQRRGIVAQGRRLVRPERAHEAARRDGDPGSIGRGRPGRAL